MFFQYRKCLQDSFVLPINAQTNIRLPGQSNKLTAASELYSYKIKLKNLIPFYSARLKLSDIYSTLENTQISYLRELDGNELISFQEYYLPY